MQSLRDCLRWSVSSFLRAGLHYGHGTDNAWDEARWLVLGALALPFDSPEWVLDARIATPERERLAQLLKRADGALYVADFNLIRKITPDFNVVTLLKLK